MKRYLILVILIALTFIVNGQRIRHSSCDPSYDFETGTEILKSSDLSSFIQLKLDSILSIQFPVYKKYLTFKVGQQYDRVLFEKRYNKNYIMPFVDIVYSLYIPDKITDTSEYQQYCVLLSLDSLGNPIQQINLPIKQWQSKKLLSKEKAIERSKKLWESTKEEIYIVLAFDKKQSCFAWSLARKADAQNRQIIVINAHNGEVIENYKLDKRSMD